MTSAQMYKTIFRGSSESGVELRVYNRKGCNPAKTSDDDKKVLKRLGFKWDRYNKSYVLENPTDEAIAEISKHVTIEKE